MKTYSRSYHSFERRHLGFHFCAFMVYCQVFLNYEDRQSRLRKNYKLSVSEGSIYRVTEESTSGFLEDIS